MPNVEDSLLLKPLSIGIDFHFQRLLETRMAILATSGAGKSYLIRVMVENISGRVQQIILDKEGEFVTLREQYPFLLIGKEEADVPISVKYAEAIAHRLLKTGISSIIDLSDLNPPDAILFVKYFGDALLNAPKEYRHALVLYVSEAQVFAPQDQSAASTDTIINLATRGRKRGICLVVDSQRSSVLNKNVIAQCLNRIIGRTGYHTDVLNSAKQLGFATKAETLSLSNLKPGDFFCVGPAVSDKVVKFRVKKAKTTHLTSGIGIRTNPPTPATIKKILKELADIPEEAEKELQSKKDYQDEIRRLQNELSTMKKVVPGANGAGKPDLVAINANAKKMQAIESKNIELMDFIKKQDQEMKGLRSDLIKTKTMITSIKKIFDNAGHVLSIPNKGSITALPILSTKSVSVPPKVDKKGEDQTPTESNGTKLGKGHKSLLTALAMYSPASIPRSRAAFIAGISPKGGYYNNIIGECKRNGWLFASGNSLGITTDGLNALGPYDPLPSSGDELVHYWIGRLGKGPAGMVRSLRNHYPHFISREALGMEVGISSAAGYFNNCMGELRTLGLIEKQGKTVRLSAHLFE